MAWEKLQTSPVHDHVGSSCWVKVLDGELRESKYAVAAQPGEGFAVSLQSERTVGAEGVAFYEGTAESGARGLGNPSSDQVGVSLHIYSPPHSVCNFYDPHTGAKTVSTLLSANFAGRGCVRHSAFALCFHCLRG